MPRTILRVEVKPLRAKNAHNIRSSTGDEAKLRPMGESLRKAQIHPILITADGRIIDGNCRVDAAILVGITHLDAIVVEGDITPDQIAETQTIAAFHAESLSDFDRAGALKLAKDKGLTNSQIAQKFDIDAGLVTKLLSVFDTIPACQEAAKLGKIGVTKWYQVSKSPDQEATLSLLLNGGTRDDAQRSVKKAKAAPAIRTAKIKCPLTSGVTVQVAGAELSLEEAIDALSEAAKQMKAAVAKGLNVKTAMSVWRDVAAG